MKKHFGSTYTFLNRYSVVFDGLASLLIVFLIELFSRRSFLSACTFVGEHTLAYLYNAFLVFVSFSLVYLVRRRAFSRMLLTSFWMLLGIINGCVLSNRVTPFGFTDLKCITELLDMTGTGYLTLPELVGIIILLIAFLILCIFLFRKLPVYQGRLHPVLAPMIAVLLLFGAIPVCTDAAQASEVVDSYYSNIAQGYQDNGFVYSFSSSVVDVGMSQPEDYSEERIDEILSETDSEEEILTGGEESTEAADRTGETSDADNVISGASHPNIICVLLESFCDPDEINFLELNEDPIPTFHKLEQEYSTGYLTVPVVGAGTANSEFEVLTGMSLAYFGTGEYPYKTILKQTDCESIASDLSSIGYATHAVHNNGGNFYSRATIFSQFGFDTFTSKELMNIKDWNPLGTWPADDILVSETIKTLDATPDQTDFTYTITVGTHGTYPTTPVIEDPACTASGALNEDGSVNEEANNQWTYYVNQLHDADSFIAGLIEELSQRDEDTILVLWGDHLPTMGLTNEDMKSGDIYKTKYVTWNNMGLEKKDADLYAYQLLSSITASVDIHEGTMMTYHQAALADGLAEEDTAAYQSGLENLQYDILYGDRYCYDGADAYPASDLVMGVEDVTVDGALPSAEGLSDLSIKEAVETYDTARIMTVAETENSSDTSGGNDDPDGDDEGNPENTSSRTGAAALAAKEVDWDEMTFITGSHFTPWSYVYINGDKKGTTFLSDTLLAVSSSDLSSGDMITVSQVGSKNTIFRTSNEYYFYE